MSSGEIKKCAKCGKEFRVEAGGDNYPGGKESEEIKCPYCGAENGSTTTSGFVRTFMID